MTDKFDQITDTDDLEAPTEAAGPNRRRMFIAGAGLAGAAALVGSKSVSAADNDPVLVGNPANTTADGATIITNTNATDTAAGVEGQEAVRGVITSPVNGSHAVRGVTAGRGHAVAGENTDPANTVGATWGRHTGIGAGISGVNNNPAAVPIAGTARGVEGIITSATNGSHAVFGVTPGDGHAIAGSSTKRDNARATTWGKHEGLGAGIGGENNAADVPIAGPAHGVEGIVLLPTNGSHAVFGITAGGGHSIAGDTPADAAGPDGVGPNTTAATWGRHGGVGAGIGGDSAAGYGGEFVGGKSHLRLIQDDDAPAGPPVGDDHLLGELYADGAGDLFYNTADGSNWVPLTQGGAGGTILFDNAARAYDTRAGSTPPNTDKTKFRAGETRVIDLNSFVPAFPSSATAALINLTVVNSEGFRGFATVFNGSTADAARPNTSNINWTSDTGVIANSSTVRADAEGRIKVYTSQPTDVIIDIQGYIA